jgi:UDP-glucose 4-epimerase
VTSTNGTTQNGVPPTTYLITGGAGFIGSHLAELLLKDGHRVLALDNLSTGNLSNLKELQQHPNYSLAVADITEETVMDRLASEADVIIHLAAAVGVQLIVQQPVHVIETNVMGAEAVFKAARRYRCRVLLASTSEVYGKGSRIPFREDDDVLLGPTKRNRWSYAATKMVDEFLGLAYHEQYGLETTVFRLFNTVGPRQTGRYGMVVPRFVRQALANEEITVYGDGSQSRCFCDVRDVVRAIYALSKSDEAVGNVYNIGSTEEVSIRELAERITQIAGSDSKLTYIPYSEAYPPGFEDMHRRVPDTSRLHGLTGWQPTRNLDDIIQAVCEFERQNQPSQEESTTPTGNISATTS